MTDPNETIVEAIAALVPALLDSLDALNHIANRFHPPHLPDYVELAGAPLTALRQALRLFQDVAWPERLGGFRDQLMQAGEAAASGLSGLGEAAASPDGVRVAYRALRQTSRAAAALYPLGVALPLVARFFLPPDLRDDPQARARLARADAARETVGVMHVGDGDRGRGGFSFYVPEYYDPAQSCPLVFALHGGAGNGRDFLWNWLPDARARGVILVAPTAIGDTWSLMDPDVDSNNLRKILTFIQNGWNIDPMRLLLSGMSDGGTFSLLSGMQADSPFTHLAPTAASFHPMLIEFSEPARLDDLPIHLTHGALDWMFPVRIGRTAATALARAGARVTYREIEDLSHTFPRDENQRLLDWFLGGPSPAG